MRLDQLFGDMHMNVCTIWVVTTLIIIIKTGPGCLPRGYGDFGWTRFQVGAPLHAQRHFRVPGFSYLHLSQVGGQAFWVNQLYTAYSNARTSLKYGQWL